MLFKGAGKLRFGGMSLLGTRRRQRVASKWKYEGGVWSSVAFGASRDRSGAAHPRSSPGDARRVLVIAQSPRYRTREAEKGVAQP